MLYVVICIATSDSLQFLFPESTTWGNGITLWNNIIAKLFGLTYKDAFEAAEKRVGDRALAAAVVAIAILARIISSICSGVVGRT